MIPSPADTIVAASTSLVGALRARIRISGRDTAGVLQRVRDSPLSRVIEFRFLPAPRTYTREPMAEGDLPGTPPLVEAVIRTCIAAGARQARPGEFTLRAYLNGRITLSEAEGVLAVTCAGTEREFQAGMRLLEGSFGRKIAALQDRLLTLCALSEAANDFTDPHFEVVDPEFVRKELACLRDELNRLLSSCRARGGQKNLASVLLVGPANAGKTTLFNRLSKEDAIVSPVAGTTRDVLSAEVRLPGFEAPIVLEDSPGVGADALSPGGLEDSAGQWEGRGRADLEGVRQTLRRIESADLLVVVIDASEAGRAEAVEKWRARLALRPHVIVHNKVDLAAAPAGELGISAQRGTGIGELLSQIALRLKEQEGGVRQAEFVIDMQQREALDGACTSLSRALEQFGTGPPAFELIACDLREAARELGSVTGASVDEEVLDRFFGRFCVGK